MSVAVSVIVPIYDVEKWIRRCLDSLVSQTLENIEIICVDDGSPDNCAEICREYAARDSRILVLSQKNGGVSTARNAGLEVATGEYIGFVDADDCVDSDFFEKLYSKAISTNADIVKGQKYQINPKIMTMALVETLWKNIGRIQIFNGNGRIKKNRGHFNYTFWTAIYKRDFLAKHGINFPVGIITAQDSLFLTKAVALANKIEIVNGTYYNYFRRPDSADSKVLGEAKILSKIKSAKLSVDFMNSVDIEPDVYAVMFKKKLKILLKKAFCRCPDSNMRLALAECAVDLFRKCKYPESCRDKKCDKFLSNNDITGLHEYLERKYF